MVRVATQVHTRQVQQASVAARIRLLALVQVCMALLVLGVDTASRQGLGTGSTLALVLIALLVSAVLYGLRNTRYAEATVYADLILVQLLILAGDPLSGSLGGEGWVLLQVWPPIAAIILGQARAAAIISGVGIVLLITAGSLQLSGVIPVELMGTPSLLTRNMGYQVVVLVIVAAVVSRIGMSEQRALTAALVAKAQLHAELARVQTLATEKERLNGELVQTVADLRERDEKLRAQEALLRQTISDLSTPVVPILDGVVVLPLIGLFNPERMQVLTDGLLAGIEQHRARVVVLDITGVRMSDSSLAQAIMQAASAARLLGATPVVVGIGPVVAQTLVELGVDLSMLVTRADLQAGVAYALRVTGQQGVVQMAG